MKYEVNFTNFKPEGYLKEYILQSYKQIQSKIKDIENLKLSFTKIDNQGYVVNFSGTKDNRQIKSWWTGLSLYYCTEKIFADFLSKAIVKNNLESPKVVNKHREMDLFGFPQKII